MGEKRPFAKYLILSCQNNRLKMTEIYEILEIVCMSAALLLFILFFFPTKVKKYFGIGAWVMLISGLFCLFPELIAEGNILYPILLVFSLVLLYIGIRRLLKEDAAMISFTKMGAVFSILYVPFLIIKPLGNLLIGSVVYWIRVVFDAVGFKYYMIDPSHPYSDHFFNFFFSMPTSNVNFLFNGHTYYPSYSGGFGDEIVLGCTGITAIALLIAIVTITNTTWIKKILLSLLIAGVIYVVNVFRNVFVIEAYFDQWFPWFEEWFSGYDWPGYASFFWSHNVICEGAAFLIIVILALILFKAAPNLLNTFRDIVMMFVTDLKGMLQKKEKKV